MSTSASGHGGDRDTATATTQPDADQALRIPNQPGSPDDAELKARLRGIWALGDYPTVASEVIPALGEVLVEACGIGPGDRVLDVAAGSGNASYPAARRGASVVASDLTPDLLAAGRDELGSEATLDITWAEDDAEALPYADASFDVVMSCVGVMFAPHHQRTADELLRVCRPGGRIGLISWTPQGFIGQLFAIMKAYVPAPPPGVQPPPLWGNEDHLTELFGDRVEDLEMTHEQLEVDRFGSGAEFREFFAQRYGPTIAAYRANASDPDRVAALDQDLEGLAERHGVSTGTMRWEYLLLTASRR